MLLVVTFEHVLLLQVAKEHHGLIKHVVDLLLGEALDALLEFVVDKEREVFGRARIQVDKMLEVGVDALLEKLVLVEGGAQKKVESFLEIEKALYEEDGRFVGVIGVCIYIGGGDYGGRCVS